MEAQQPKLRSIDRAIPDYRTGSKQRQQPYAMHHARRQNHRHLPQRRHGYVQYCRRRKQRSEAVQNERKTPNYIPDSKACAHR